ncbi:hypothetical protein NLI96_g2021 [Meripilus lineatus]|uniref:VHS domain-containing protein n=1 Tax=Meripilus lineatus TaxID=2056292 RepID=A0AAD5YMA3_9APHY|nr:hypothetical protein NLI96_g2021 [Physisporinus lineatus]
MEIVISNIGPLSLVAIYPNTGVISSPRAPCIQILRALVENCGHKFQTSFADAQLTDAIKSLASDPSTDPKVKKKLLSVLISWHSQFKDDPFDASHGSIGHHDEALERRKREERERKEKKEEDKRKAKLAKEEEKAKQRREEELRRKRASQPRRRPFNFEEEKPQILTSIANASQASNNLVNAITLVNTEHDSLQENERVQECLEAAKLARKQIVRYIQMVENEDMIGTLIDTNERIITALETYDKLTKPSVTEDDVKDVQDSLAAAKIHDSEIGRLQEKQKAAVQRSLGRVTGQSVKERNVDSDPYQTGSSSHIHPDLQDLSFGPLGAEQSKLPPPMRPTTTRNASDDEDSNWRSGRGSLSDFSDYQSSDEETHNRASTSATTHRSRDYVTVSDEEGRVGTQKTRLLDDSEEDPFADPFAD